MSDIIITNKRLKDIVELFIVELKPNTTLTTLKNTKHRLNVFINWLNENQLKEDIKTSLLTFKSFLKDKYNSASSINAVLSTVRTFYKWLYSKGLIEYNPAQVLTNEKTNDDVKRAALSKYQIEQIYNKFNRTKSSTGQRDKLIFTLGLMNGLRVNELANIRIEDISEIQGHTVVYLLRKGYSNKDTYVKLKDDVAALLSAYIGDKTNGYLFTNSRTNDRLTTDSISRIIKGIYISNGLNDKKLTAHSLRHTYALLCLDGGADIMSLSVSMNHKNISTTQHYLKSFNKLKNSAADKINIGVL